MGKWMVAHSCKGRRRNISFSKDNMNQEYAACLKCGEIFIVKIEKIGGAK